MRRVRWAWRSVWFYRRFWLGTWCVVVWIAAVWVGIFVAKDSIQATLRRRVDLRLGHVQLVLEGGDRLFTERLAVRIQAALNPPGQMAPIPAPAAGVLYRKAVARRVDSQEAVGDIHVYGVPLEFWKLALEVPRIGLPKQNLVLVSQAFAQALHVKPGDRVILGIRRPVTVPSDWPWLKEEELYCSLPVQIGGIVSDREMGRFCLFHSQSPPRNVFVDLGLLQKILRVGSRVNLLLIGRIPETLGQKGQTNRIRYSVRPNTAKDLRMVLRRAWDLSDAQLSWRIIPEQNVIELRSDRGFLDPFWSRLVSSTSSMDPQIRRFRIMFRGMQVCGIQSYFVPQVRYKNRTLQNPILIAAQPPLAPWWLRSNQVVLARWAARALGVSSNAVVTVHTRSETGREQDLVFRVVGIVDPDRMGWDSELMPHFGLTNSVPPSCAFPAGLISWETGQRIWGDERLMVIRFRVTTFPQRPITFSTRRSILRSFQQRMHQLLVHLVDPQSLGFVLRPVREEAMREIQNSFLNTGFFLGGHLPILLGGLLLVGTLFRMQIRQRAWETDLFHTFGFLRRDQLRIWIREGATAGFFGIVVGAGLGLIYGRFLLWLFQVVGRDWFGDFSLSFAPRVSGIFLGSLWAWGVCVAAMFLALWGTLHQAIQKRAVWFKDFDLEPSFPARTKTKAAWGWIGGWIGIGIGCMVLPLILPSFSGQRAVFHGLTGICLVLVWGQGVRVWILYRQRQPKPSSEPSLQSLLFRFWTFDPRPIVGIVTIVALGVFAVVNHSGFWTVLDRFRVFGRPLFDSCIRVSKQERPNSDGFAWILQTTHPVRLDLQRPEGRRYYGLKEEVFQNVQIVPGYLLEGDDFAPGDLIGMTRPTIVGIPLNRWRNLQGIDLEETIHGVPLRLGWDVLSRDQLRRCGVELTTNEVPAVVEVETLRGILRKRLGDSIAMMDERGRTIQLRLVGGINAVGLHGWIFIAQQEFRRLFPSQTGFRWFWIETSTESAETVRRALVRAFGPLGCQILSARERQKQAARMEHTVRKLFEGGMGVGLGMLGLWVGVVSVFLLQVRRRELELLQVLGLPFRDTEGEEALSEELQGRCSFPAATSGDFPLRWLLGWPVFFVCLGWIGGMVVGGIFLGIEWGVGRQCGVAVWIPKIGMLVGFLLLAWGTTAWGIRWEISRWKREG